MNIQVIGTKKCQDTKKALRFFKERRLEIHFVDLNERTLSAGELRNILQRISPEDLMDREGKQFQKRGLQYMKFDIEEELLEDSLLIKTPIVRSKNMAVAGYKPEEWESLIESS